MGLIVSNLKYKDYLNEISFKIGKNNIFGIYGNYSKYILDILNGDILDYSGVANYDKMDIDELFFKEHPTIVARINTNPNFYSTKVEDEFKFTLEYRRYDGDINKAIKKALKLVELDEKILSRSINTLSRSEKYLLGVAVNISYNPELIIFDNIFSGIDHKNKKKLITLINNLKEEKKLIIVTSNDVNILYEITDEVLLLDGNNLYKVGSTDKIFTSNELMKGDIVPMPNITKVTYLAKTKKNVKLSYHKDVRDIIKDIYKHV